MNDNITTTLNQRVGELIEKFKKLQEENENLMNELTQVKGKCEAQALEISKLEEELLEKNILHEDIERQIEQILGK